MGVFHEAFEGTRDQAARDPRRNPAPSSKYTEEQRKADEQKSLHYDKCNFPVAAALATTVEEIPELDKAGDIFTSYAPYQTQAQLFSRELTEEWLTEDCQLERLQVILASDWQVCTDGEETPLYCALYYGPGNTRWAAVFSGAVIYGVEKSNE